MDCFTFLDENNNSIDYLHCERDEQELCLKYVPEDSCGVLELGARYGTVTSTISHKLNHRPVLICVEPDQAVIDALRKNIERNNTKAFVIPHIVSGKPYGFINNGYESMTIPLPENLGPEYKMYSLPLESILHYCGISKIDTLVADCEGFLENFFDENPNLYNDLKVVIFEADCSHLCDYNKIRTNLSIHGFHEEVGGIQNVWLKSSRECTTNESTFEFFNEHNIKIDRFANEVHEQYLALKYVPEDSCGVLELGGRYGSVTCCISHKLNRRPVLISIEPDPRIFDVLYKNIKRNNAIAYISPYIISNKAHILVDDGSFEGYATYSEEYDEQKHPPNSKIISTSLESLLKKYNVSKIDTLVADCEGFLETFLDEHPNLYNELRVIIFEADAPHRCNYYKIRKNLFEHGFREEIHGHQNVWLKDIQ